MEAPNIFRPGIFTWRWRGDVTQVHRVWKSLNENSVAVTLWRNTATSIRLKYMRTSALISTKTFSHISKIFIAIFRLCAVQRFRFQSPSLSTELFHIQSLLMFDCVPYDLLSPHQPVRTKGHGCFLSTLTRIWMWLCKQVSSRSRGLPPVAVTLSFSGRTHWNADLARVPDNGLSHSGTSARHTFYQNHSDCHSCCSLRDTHSLFSAWERCWRGANHRWGSERLNMFTCSVQKMSGSVRSARA